MTGGRSVSVRLRLEVSDYMANAKQAQKATGDFLGELGKSKKASQELSSAMLLAGGVLAGGFLFAADASMKFEKQMSEVKAVTGAAAGEMEKLRSAAITSGKDTQYSATEAAKAQAELAKAGLSTTDILNGGLKGALALAAAGSLDLATAADIAAKAMSQFGLSGQAVGHIADMLAGGANATATDVEEMGQALKMGGGAAHAMGLSLDDTVVTLGAFTKGALVGSDAGTSLKTMMMMLAAPTKKAQTLMDDLGISAFNAQGEFVGVYQLADNLQKSLGGLTQQERMAALATIFGADAMRAANVLYEQGSDGLKTLNQQIHEQGDAAKLAGDKTDNLAGDLERLKGSIETLAIEAGSGANGGLRALTQAADKTVEAFGRMPDELQTTLVVLTGVSGAALLAAGGFLKARETAIDTLAALRDMGPAGGKAADGLEKVGKYAGYAALGVAGLGLAYVGANLLSDLTGASKQVLITSANVEKLTDSLGQLSRTGQVSGELAKMFGSDLGKLKKDFADIEKIQARVNEIAEVRKKAGDLAWAGVNPGGVQDFQKSYEHMLNQIKQDIGGVDKALAGLVTGGNTTAAKMAVEDMAQRLGIPVEELISKLPEYSTAVDGAVIANSGMAKGFGDVTSNARTMASTLDQAVLSGQKLTDIFNQLNGANLGVSDAEIRAEASTRALKDALEQSHGSLAINTDEGGKAQQALNDLARAGAAAMEAMYAQTGSVDLAAQEFEKYRQKLIETLIQSGRTRGEAEALANQYMQVPPTVATTMMLYGDADANARIQAIKNSLDRIPGSKTINITAKADLPSGLAMGALMRADGGTVDFFANGGVRGRENHVADIVPAGTWRVWGEPETGGEAYIPFAQSKRARSVEVLAEANRRLGSPLTDAVYHHMAASGAAASGAAQAAAPAAQSIDPAVLGQAMRIALAGMAVTLDSARIGQVQGREGDLLRRGG